MPRVGKRSAPSKSSNAVDEGKKRRRVVAKSKKAGVDVDVDANETFTTVKCCLRKHLRDRNMVVRMEHLSSYMGRVNRDGSMFVNVYLLRLLEEGQGRLPEWLEFDQSWFNQCFTVVGTPCGIQGTSRNRFLRVIDAYPELFSSPYRRQHGDTQIINQSCRAYMTNFVDHHERHRFARAKKYMRFRLGEAACKSLQPGEWYQLCRLIYEDNLEDVAVPHKDWMPAATPWLMELRRRFKEADVARHECAQIRATTCDPELRKLRIQASMARAMRRKVEFTYWIGIKLHDYFVDVLTRPVSSLKNKKEKTVCLQQRAAHAIAPICDVKRPSVLLTNTIIHDYFGVPEEEDAFAAIFRGIAKLRSSSRGWHVDNVCTDGVSLCVRFCKRTVSKMGSDRECGESTRAAEDPDNQDDVPRTSCEPLDNVRVLGADPGVVNTLYLVEELPGGSTRTWCFATKQYYHEAFIWKFRNRMNEAKDSIAVIMNELSSCVRKTVRLTLQLEYWKAYVRHRDTLFGTLATKERCKLSMNVYINGTASIDRFLRSLEDGSGRAIIIGYGGATMPVGMRGRVSAPSTRIYKRCSRMYRTVVTPEQYTSQKCPRCDCQLVPKMEHRMCNDGVQRLVESRAVKRCTSSPCVLRATSYESAYMRNAAVLEGSYEWCRDKVGAWNILKCTLAALRGEARPAHLDFDRRHRRR